MTLEEVKSKISITEKNKVLTEGQRKALLDVYQKKLAELEPESAKNSIKERAKKVPSEIKEKVAKTVANAKTESKKIDYNCDDLVKEAKERHAKAKEAAKDRASAPKKTEVTKSKEKIERAHEAIEKQVEAGKLAKAQLIKLRDETKDLLSLLEKAIKNS